MPNEELISEYIDEAAFKAQTDFAVREVERLLSGFESLKKAKADIAGGKGLGDISAGVRQAEKDTQLLLKTQRDLATTKLAEIKLDNELLKNAALKERAADRIIKKEQEAAALKAKNTSPEFEIKTGGENDAENIKKTGVAVNELDRAQAEAAISATQFSNANRSSGKVVIETKKSVHDLNKEVELKKQLDRQAAQELKNTVREENAVKGSLEQRRAALIRLNAVYDNQSPQERASAAGQRLQKIIGGLDAQVKSLESTTGRAQRNVGNYGSAFNTVTQGASKAFSILRNITYVVPGIGIAGLIGAIIDPLIAGTKYLLGFSEVSEKVKKQQEEIASSFKQAADSVGEEIAKVTILKTVLESDTATRLQKITALKQLKEANIDYFGQLDLEDGKVKGLASAYDAYTTKLIRSITAKANIQQLTDAIKEQQNVVGKLNTNSPGKDGPFTIENLTEYQKLQALTKFNLKFGTKKGEAALITQEQEQLIVDLLNSEFKVKEITDRIKGEVQDAFNPEKEPTGKKAAGEKQIQALKELLNTQFEIYKIDQQAKIRLFERDINSDKVHYLDKLTALDNYLQASQELILAQEKNDILNKQNETAGEIQRLEEEKAGKTLKQKERINENIKILEKNLQQSILLIQKDAADKSAQLAENAADKRPKILDDQLKKDKDFYDEYAKMEQDLIDKTNERYKKGLEKREQQEKDAKAKLLELEKELNEKRLQAAAATGNLLYKLAVSSYDRQLNLNKDQQDEIDKRKEAELAANDQVVQSEQQKAANIAIINSRAQIEKDKLDRESRAIQTKKAQFERAQQIFEIEISTIRSIAEIKAKVAVLLASGLPGARILAARAAAQIPWVLGTSAAAIGALLATPLPKFFKGKGPHDKYEGFATVNEIRDEVIQRADGRFEFPTGRNVLTHVGKDDIIHPDKNKWMNAMLNAAHRDANTQYSSTKAENPLINEIKGQTKLLKLIANRPVATTSATNTGLVQVMKWGSNQIKYVDQNTNW